MKFKKTLIGFNFFLCLWMIKIFDEWLHEFSLQLFGRSCAAVSAPIAAPFLAWKWDRIALPLLLKPLGNHAHGIGTLAASVKER